MWIFRSEFQVHKAERGHFLMTELVIHDELADRLREIARRENRSVEAVLVGLLELYSAPPESRSYPSAETSSDPLEAMAGMFDDDITDLSATVRATMTDYYRKKYGSPG